MYVIYMYVKIIRVCVCVCVDSNKKRFLVWNLVQREQLEAFGFSKDGVYRKGRWEVP